MFAFFLLFFLYLLDFSLWGGGCCTLQYSRNFFRCRLLISTLSQTLNCPSKFPKAGPFRRKVESLLHKVYRLLGVHSENLG